MKKPQKNTAGTLTPDIKTLLFFRVAITGIIYLILVSLHKEVVLNPYIIMEEKDLFFLGLNYQCNTISEVFYFVSSRELMDIF